MAYIPNPNQSVSGTVGASIIGLPPVNLNVGGNPVSTSNPVAVQPPASGSLPITQVGSVITVSQGSVGAVIIGGSIAASFTPPANQSVSGTIDIGNFPTSQNVSGSVVAFQGTTPFIITGSVQGNFGGGNSSVQVLNFPTNTSVSGTIQAEIRGSVATVIIGGSIATTTGNSSVQVLNFPANQSVSGEVSVSNFPTTQNISGSVIAFLNSTNASIITVGSPVANQSVSGTVGASIIGAVPTTQTGIWISSVVNTIPSSMLVGASIIGMVPVTVNGQVGTQMTSVTGTVTANQGTGFGSIAAHIKSGSVLSAQFGTWAPSAIGYVIRNDAVASFLGANLTYRTQAGDSAGRILTKPFAPEEARIEGYNSVVSTSVTTLVAAAGAGLKNYITDVVLINTGATTTLVTFRSGGGTSVLGYGIAPAGGGSNMLGFAMPMRTLANQTFDFQTTSSSSIIYAKVSGFKAP